MCYTYELVFQQMIQSVAGRKVITDLNDQKDNTFPGTRFCVFVFFFFFTHCTLGKASGCLYTELYTVYIIFLFNWTKIVYTLFWNIVYN